MTSSPTVSRQVALRDLGLIIATLLISKSVLLQFDAIWTFAGPISLVLTFGIATILLKRSGEGWTGVGLVRPPSWVKLAIWTVIALVVGIGVDIGAQVLTQLSLPPPSETTQAIDSRYQGRFSNLPGNLPVFLMWLALAWIIGGFIEEMLFRGALITRLEQALKGLPLGVFLAIILQGVLFGQQHYYYQGWGGFIATGLVAIASGVLYLVFKRNLWPFILSHGLSNTIGLTVLYFSTPA